MALQPLLPCYDPDLKWPQVKTEPGFCEINPNDFSGRMYTAENITSRGIPSPLAQAFTFKWALEHGLKWQFYEGGEVETSEVFSLILKGLFTGALRLEQMPLDNLGSLGEVLKVALPPSIKDFGLIVWSGEVIGGTYHETFVFPAASLTNEKWGKLRKAVIDIEKKSLGVLKGWTSAKMRQIESQEKKKYGYQRPLWLEWMHRFADSLPISGATEEEIKSSTILLPGVMVSDGLGGYTPLSFPRFVRSVLRCPQCGFILSSIEGEQKIDAVNRILRCPDCSQTFTEDFKEKGFFLDEAKNKYIIWNIEDGALPDGCTGVLYDENGATYSFGNYRIRVAGEVLDLDRVGCKSVIGFSLPDGELKIPDQPVKGEYLKYVIKVESMGREGDRGEWRLTLRGQPSPVRFTARIQLGEKGEYEGSILVWPSFRAEGWNLYYLYFICTGYLGSRKVAVRPIVEGSEPLSTVIYDRQACRVFKPLKWVEVFVEERAAGIFRFDPEQIGSGGSNIRVSLDFGTSNTCVAMETGRPDTGEYGYEVIECHDLTHDIIGSHFDRAQVASGSEWLPTYRERREDSVRSFPAELIFFEGLPPDLPDLDKPPIIERISYMIPNPEIGRMEQEEAIVSNFKWDIERESSLYARREDVVSEYLRLILHIALGELRSSRYRVNGRRIVITGIKLVATYPLAIGIERHKSYMALLNILVERVRSETGVVIAVEPPGLLNESYAGKSSVGSPGGLELMADLGGGTTDIAFSAHRELIFVDSIRYSDNSLIELLAKGNYLPDRQLRGLSSLLRDLTPPMRRTRLQQIFRYGEPDKIWNELYHTESLPKVKDLVNLFFDGLIWYLVTLVAAYLRRNNESRKPELTVFLLGNGWNFIRASGQTPRAYVAEAIRKEIERLIGKSIKINIPDIAKYGMAQNPKEATSIGALQCTEADPGVLDGIRSIVGCKTTIKVGYETTELNPDDLIPAEVSGTSGSKSMSCDGILEVLPEEWKREPLEFDEEDRSLLNQKYITSVNLVGKVLKLQKSILSRFLEEVYLTRLSKIAG